MVEKYVIRLGRFLIAVLYNFYFGKSAATLHVRVHYYYQSMKRSLYPYIFPRDFKDEMLPTTGLLFLEGRILS